MNEGSVVLITLRQADGGSKSRPAVLLRQLPGYGDWLVCGISTQIRQFVSGFDEQISLSDPDFRASGVVQASIIRLSFLQAAPRSNIVGTIGQISATRHRKLLENLSRYLQP